MANRPGSSTYYRLNGPLSSNDSVAGSVQQKNEWPITPIEPVLHGQLLDRQAIQTNWINKTGRTFQGTSFGSGLVRNDANVTDINPNRAVSTYLNHVNLGDDSNIPERAFYIDVYA